ncbi:cysteine-rich CWC family protein [Polaromonas sp. YR568]|uniref:cysteine-rich CWC family protein n=1 Tax=Polaromonas sp. YR568 TaxID=1855301 RepID=UPI003137E753
MSTPVAEAEPAPASSADASSVCPRCGAGFRCGMVSGDATCWCFQLPPVLPVPATDDTATTCFCPKCLAELTTTAP